MHGAAGQVLWARGRGRLSPEGGEGSREKGTVIAGQGIVKRQTNRPSGRRGGATNNSKGEGGTRGLGERERGRRRWEGGGPNKVSKSGDRLPEVARGEREGDGEQRQIHGRNLHMCSRTFG